MTLKSPRVLVAIANEETLCKSILYACQNNSKLPKDVWNCVTAHAHTCPCIHYEIVWQHIITRVQAYIMKLCDRKWSHVSMHALWNCVTTHDHKCPCIHYETMWKHMITRVHAYIMKLCDRTWSHVSMLTLRNCVTPHDHMCTCIHYETVWQHIITRVHAYIDSGRGYLEHSL